MNPYTSLAVFVCYFCADVLYAKFVQYITNKQAAKAATCSAMIALIMTLGIMQCIDNQLYLIPLLAGAWLGTFFAVNVS